MNETIGVKGGYQDRKRSLKIKKEIAKKLQEQEENEKTRELNILIKNKNIINRINFIPFVLVGKKLVKESKQNNNSFTQIKIEQIRKVDRIPIKKKEKKEEKVIKEEEHIIEEFPFKDNYKPNLSNIQNNKIIEQYQKKLRSIRNDLKQLVYDSKIIDKEENNIYTSKEAEELLIRLNTLIQKLEKLKSKYSIDKIERYDENYIVVLIEDYINEFKNKKFVKEIKNSDIYILISQKLNELELKKENIENKITEKKNKLLLTENELEHLKERYDEFDRFNILLLEFQNEQDKILKEMNEQLEKASSIEEKIEIKVKAMDKQSKKLLRIIGLQLFLPIPKQVKRVVTSTALYMYYMKRIIKPEVETKKYKVVKVTDYSNEIKKNIESIENIENMIGKTSQEIDKIINRVKDEFKEYFGKIKQCDELFKNLERIKFEIKDKEDEIKRIKKEQIKKLEQNDLKIKTLNNTKINNM